MTFSFGSCLLDCLEKPLMCNIIFGFGVDENDDVDVNDYSDDKKRAIIVSE